MPDNDLHVSDSELIAAADGELPPESAVRVDAHLAACWMCRSRMAEIENTIGVFVRAHMDELDRRLPPADGPRALLRARLAEAAAAGPESRWGRWLSVAFQGWRSSLVQVAAVFVVVAVCVFEFYSYGARAYQKPDLRLTPGAASALTRDQVCSAEPAAEISADSVPQPVALVVFAAYGIRDPHPGDYEMDYLISPELGGSNDVRNLWPQRYASGEWNSHVKDALEDHLRELVCAGRLDLSTAQHDLATDWISAYKHYFATDRPLAIHTRFSKDPAWY